MVVYDEDTPRAIIATLLPDVLVKGGTYPTDGVVGHEVVEAYGGRVYVTGRTPGRSTSSLLSAIRTETNRTQTIPINSDTQEIDV